MIIQICIAVIESKGKRFVGDTIENFQEGNLFSDGFGNNMNADSYIKAIQAGIDVISTNKISVICEAAERL